VVGPVVDTVTAPVTKTLQNIPPAARFASVLSPRGSARPLLLASFTGALPAFPTTPSTSAGAAGDTSLGSLFGDIAKFFVGILPPASWIAEGIDMSHGLTLGIILLFLLLGVLCMVFFRSIYRRLRRVQRDIYLMNDDLSLERALNPGTAKISAASISVILVGIFVASAILSGL